MSLVTFYSNTNNTKTKPPHKIEIKFIDTRENKGFIAKVISWITVTEIKQMIQKGLGIPITQQRLFISTQELTKNNSSLLSYCSKKKCVIHIRPPPRLETNTGIIKRYEALPRNQSISLLVMSVQKGFNLGLYPKLTLNGTSGTYSLQNKNRKTAAIFKPFDEEPFAPNNPRGYVGKLGSQGFRPGILSGESALREVAAFLLDEDGIYNVPPTTFVEIIHPYFAREKSAVNIEEEKFDMIPIQSENQTQANKNQELIIKHGSLQQFIENAEEAGDYGYSTFPDEEVRKIAILDIRILNCDRNEGNILVHRINQKFNLIPIDHGLCLPDNFSICSYEIVWMDWPQIKKPFTIKELEHINKIDPKEDVLKLSKYLKFRSICLRNFRIAENLLKIGAKSGLTLYEIGSIIYKEDPDQISPLEDIVSRVEEIYFIKKNSEMKNLIWEHKLLGKNNNNSALITAVQNGFNTKNGFDILELKTMNGIHNGVYDSQNKKKTLNQELINERVAKLINDSDIIDNNNNEKRFSQANLILKSNKNLDAELSQILGGLTSIKEENTNDGCINGTDLNDIPKRISLKKNQSNYSKNSFKTEKTINSDISEESSSSDEDDSNGLNDSIEDYQEMSPFESITKRNFSFFPNQKIQRVNSLPQIMDNHQLINKTNQENESIKEELSNKNRLNTNAAKSKDSQTKEYDESFYYYFQCLLSQKIEIILKNKKNPEEKIRQRFLSLNN